MAIRTSISSSKSMRKLMKIQMTLTMKKACLVSESRLSIIRNSCKKISRRGLSTNRVEESLKRKGRIKVSKTILLQ